MDHKGIKKRCQNSKFLKKVYLKDHKFIYDKIPGEEPTANIKEMKGALVWGGLFNIDKEDLASLDYYENYPFSYQRKRVQVVDKQGNTYRAITYYRKSGLPTNPKNRYRKIVIRGAKDCDLPKDYIKENL